MGYKLLDKDYFDDEKQYFADFCVEHRAINMHSHEFWEISYVYEGRGTHHFADGKTEPIKEGEFVFIAPGAEHCITSPPPEQGGWVWVCNFLMSQKFIDKLKKSFLSIPEFDEFKLRNMIEKNMPFCIHLSDDSYVVHSLLMAAAHEYKHFTGGSNEIVQNTALSLLIFITRLYENSFKNNTVSNTKDEIMDDLIRYIKSNFGSDMTLGHLAAYTHLSPAYLSRYFKKSTGMNLSEFITETRIDRAKTMLRTSNHSINDISLYCGYMSISSFQKAFKKAVGMTAGEYRKSRKK